MPAGDPDSGSPEGFLRSLRGQLPGRGQQGPNGYEALRAAVDELHHAGRRVVLLLDDFHIVTSSHSFPLEFFSFLRSLANNFNLACVTTSFLELQKLCAVKDVQESPFFNIFTNLSLGMLSRSEAAGLVATLTGWQEEPCVRLADWCGGSPYLLKLAAARLLRERAEVPAGSAELERLLLAVVSPHFEEVVSLLSREASRPLQALARGKPPDSSEAHYLSPLVKQGFLAEKADGAACVSPAFCAFLRGSFSPKMLRGRG